MKSSPRRNWLIAEALFFYGVFSPLINFWSYLKRLAGLDISESSRLGSNYECPV
jgi:hypothetical protein